MKRISLILLLLVSVMTIGCMDDEGCMGMEETRTIIDTDCDTLIVFTEGSAANYKDTVTYFPWGGYGIGDYHIRNVKRGNSVYFSTEYYNTCSQLANTDELTLYGPIIDTVVTIGDEAGITVSN